MPFAVQLAPHDYLGGDIKSDFYVVYATVLVCAFFFSAIQCSFGEFCFVKFIIPL